MKSYEELIGKHEGESVFILGAGPSLWFDMYNPLFTYLHTYGIVMTVNSAVIADPGFDYWISNDALCRRWSWWDTVKKGKGKKIVRDSWLKYKNEIKDFYIFKPRPTSEDIVNSDDKGLCYCSSVPSAIDLAIQMGCKKVFLLGVDQCLDERTRYHHFWQFFPKNKRPKQIKPAQANWENQKKVFAYNNMSYKALKKFAEHKKCKIYNISRMSENGEDWVTDIDIFEIIYFNQLEKVLGKNESK